MLLSRIAELDRAEYRKVRAEIWEAVARSHARKSDAQLDAWVRNAS